LLVVIRRVHALLPAADPVNGTIVPPGRGEGLASGSSRPDLAVGLEALDLLLPLGLVLPEAPEESFFFGVVFSYALQASLDEPLHVGGVEGQTQVEDLPVVALPVVAMVVPYSCSAGEALFPSPAGCP
jgi:hypothetical protein